jgi:LEA14-like dessication related protein
MKSSGSHLILLILLLTLSACQNILNVLQQTQIKRPEVSVTKTEITGLSFTHLEMLFDLSVKNPNSVGIKLQGLDYKVLINDNSFLNGNQVQGIEIAAQAENAIQIPVTFKFTELYQGITSLMSQDTSVYHFDGGLTFDLPVLGATRVPVSKKGIIPLPKIPHIRLEGIKLNSLNLTGAKLELKLNIDNPNAFDVLLNTLTYGLTVNGLNWVQGQTNSSLSLSGKKDQTVTIPLTLNLMQMGTSVYQLLMGGKNLSYQLTGDLNVSVPQLMMSPSALPFDQSGQIDLKK